jgi:hypothetical protein
MHRDVHTQECSARSSAHLTVVHWPLHVGIPGILHGCNIFRVKMVVASHKPNHDNAVVSFFFVQASLRAATPFYRFCKPSMQVFHTRL